MAMVIRLHDVRTSCVTILMKGDERGCCTLHEFIGLIHSPPCILLRVDVKICSVINPHEQGEEEERTEDRLANPYIIIPIIKSKFCHCDSLLPHHGSSIGFCFKPFCHNFSSCCRIIATSGCPIMEPQIMMDTVARLRHTAASTSFLNDDQMALARNSPETLDRLVGFPLAKLVRPSTHSSSS